MSHPNPSTALARTVVDTLVRHGVGTLALSPGSRSGALAIAASQHRELTVVVFLDERSAAFFALGVAKASQGPAAVLCTSGTAAANWFPAVVEADASCAPLILLTADRPEELRGVGANQTIDQVELYGNKVRFFADIPAPDGSDEATSWRAAVAGAVVAARGIGARPGPSHLNISFREPTVPVSDDGRSRAEPYAHSIEPHSCTDSTGESGHQGDPRDAGTGYRAHGVVIAGDGDYDRVSLLATASGLGWPVLATALSGMRGMDVIGSYHHIIGTGLPEALRPAMVVAVGAIGPSARLERLFDSAEVRVRVDTWGRAIDPGRNATHRVCADPVRMLAGLRPERPDPDWMAAWARSGGKVESALADVLESPGRPTSAGVADRINHVERGALVVASSLPIRAVDAHLRTAGPVVANRGASGIDGFVSTALGVAATFPGTVAVSGDLSLFHDSNGLMNDGQWDLTIVVIDNGGGGLFDLLPQRIHAPGFERLFIAPQDRSIADLAAFHRVEHDVVGDLSALVAATTDRLADGGLHLLEVPVRRDDDLEMWRRLDDAARSVLG